MKQSVGRSVIVAIMLAATVVVAGPAQEAEATGCAIGTPAGDYASQVESSAGHARIWRLYQAFFLRQPDENGFAYWASVRSSGVSLSDIAFHFANGPEFEARYGALSNHQFVDLVYANVLCRAPDASGLAYWVGLLESGSITRWDLMVNFVELREYLDRTGTCHSIYPAESASVSKCPESNLVPLSEARYGAHGYQAFDASVAGGSIRGAKIDLTRPLLETGSSRCSVVSINANWLEPREKDRANPSVLGIGVVDGVHVKGSAERSDRGVFGLRFDSSPTSVVEVWPGDTLSDDDNRLNSVVYHKKRRTIESWHAAAELSPYLSEVVPQEIVSPDEWVWAAAGVPLLIDGQLDSAFGTAYAADPYTYQTLRHSFVAVDQDYNKLYLGATSTIDTLALVQWAQASGFEDLVKFDGGASTELNIAGRAAVAGTSRDIPVWLGIGC